MNLEEIKDKKSLTWGDLVDCIESVLNDIDKDTTAHKSIERYEQFNVDMKQRLDNMTEESQHNNIVSLFGVALDFILTVSIKRHYKYTSLALFKHNVDTLGDIDDEQMGQLLSTIVLILKMSKHAGKIILLDQCEFVDKDTLN